MCILLFALPVKSGHEKCIEIFLLFSQSWMLLYLVSLSFVEWPGYKGGKVKEADEGEEEQSQNDPWCKEGKGFF